MKGLSALVRNKEHDTVGLRVTSWQTQGEKRKKLYVAAYGTILPRPVWAVSRCTVLL